MISVELNDLTSSSHMAPETTNYNGVKKVWFSLSRLLVSRNDFFFLVIKLLFLQANGKHESSIIKGIWKRKISFLIPLAFSFRAVNTVLWKVNIDQHDTSVEQRQNLSSWLDRIHDLSNAGRALYILSYENSWKARSFNWVRCSGGHGCDSCRGLRFCLCSTFVSCLSINPSHFVAELKIHHLFLLINTILSQLFTRWSFTREKWCFLLVT